VHGAAATFDLPAREVVGVSAVDAVDVHEIHVRELACVVNRSPRAGQRRQ
jgi:hypothetical protein